MVIGCALRLMFVFILNHALDAFVPYRSEPETEFFDEHVEVPSKYVQSSEHGRIHVSQGTAVLVRACAWRWSVAGGFVCGAHRVPLRVPLAASLLRRLRHVPAPCISGGGRARNPPIMNPSSCILVVPHLTGRRRRHGLYCLFVIFFSHRYNVQVSSIRVPNTKSQGSTASASASATSSASATAAPGATAGGGTVVSADAAGLDAGEALAESAIYLAIGDLGQREKSGNIFREGIFPDSVWLTTRAEGPRKGALHVRGAKRDRLDRRSWITLPLFARPRRVRVPSRSISPPWGSIRFRLALRTYAPWGVRVVSQTKSRKMPTRKIYRSFREQTRGAAA